MKFFLFFILISISLSFRFFVFEFFLVLNSEMLPTLLKNDFIGVLKTPFVEKISRGDIVLIRDPDESLVVRRIIGTPQDRIFYSKKNLYINEKSHRPRLPEGILKKEKSFLKPINFENLAGANSNEWLSSIEHWQEDLEGRSYSIFLKKGSFVNFGPYKVPKDRYFVMGDHRTASRDSRNWAVQSGETQGEIIFSRKDINSSEAILIPKGTLIVTEENSYFPLFFETIHEVILKDFEVKVRVKFQGQGLRGNVSKGKKWVVLSELKDVLEVRNETSFFGGQDESVIPLSAIKGKVVFVLWSCEKSIEFLDFLCHFSSFRKGRWFRRVQ